MGRLENRMMFLFGLVKEGNILIFLLASFGDSKVFKHEIDSMDFLSNQHMRN